MTSNERIILKCLWDAKGKAHICFISRTAGFSSDYARLLCRSLERGGYLKFADVNVCCLLTKGRNRFQGSGPAVETAQDDAIVNPEIIVETVSASISEKDEPSSETGDEKLVEEIQNEILKEETELENLENAFDNEKAESKK